MKHHQVIRLVCLLLIGVLSLTAQVGRIGGAYHLPAATMHGTLKKITSKDIIIIVEGDQAVTIDRTRKTKFIRAGKEIKPAQIAVGSELSIEVSQDPQLAPLALTVTVVSAAPVGSPSQ